MFRFAIEKPLIIAVGVLIICLFGILAAFARAHTDDP